MIFERLVVGPLQCNCAILACEKTKEAVVIDPGDEATRIVSAIQSRGYDVKYLLHTHAHFDHIGATAELRKAVTAPVCLHKGDHEIFKNLPMQGQMFGMQFGEAPEVEKFLEDNEVLKFGNQSLEVVHTPGHSPGGLCFKVSGDEEMLFSGDSLFQMSIGRTDLWGGNFELLIKSIKERVFSLEGEMPVHPGHGPSTRVGDEKRLNPFFK
jgi:hydroxyacylglutathione hydrolase